MLQNPRTMSGSVEFPAPMLSVQDFGVGRAPRAGGVAAHPVAEVQKFVRGLLPRRGRARGRAAQLTTTFLLTRGAAGAAPYAPPLTLCLPPCMLVVVSSGPAA
jgi:hypothetical protein